MRTILLILLYLLVCIISIPLLLVECIVRKINSKVAAAFAIRVVRSSYPAVKSTSAVPNASQRTDP